MPRSIFHSLLFDQLTQPGFEPTWTQIEPHLDQINSLVQNQTHDPEGSIYYPQGQPASGPPHSMFRTKRQALYLLATMHDRVLEIGFNAGHSALLMLCANPRLYLTSIDTAQHAYTRPCAEYVRRQFGNRFELVMGSSQECLPGLDLAEFTAFHVDGSHQVSDAAGDMLHIMQSAANGSVVVFDDAGTGNLRMMLSALILGGGLTPLVVPGGILDGQDQMFFRINR
jgi:predicted O-methyltransferase YrrM